MLKNNILQRDYTLSSLYYQTKLPLDIEVLIPADDPVRLLSAFVEGMDLSDLYKTYGKVKKSQASPRQLLKIAIYASMNRLYSSRDIETACHRDINFRYLLEGNPAPDHATIARFISLHLAYCSKDTLAEMTTLLYGFGDEECKDFLAAIDDYLKETREITGYQSIKFLSSMNLASRKLFEEKLLANWDYENYKYQIMDPENEDIQNYLYILRKDSVFDDLKDMEKAYVGGKLYKTMLGTNEYAESFITSEWLYYSLKGRKNFDYTSVTRDNLPSKIYGVHRSIRNHELEEIPF